MICCWDCRKTAAEPVTRDRGDTESVKLGAAGRGDDGMSSSTGPAMVDASRMDRFPERRVKMG